ncbi:calcium-binding and spermatid-specific protein 1 isoform X2 [Antechinus flavipes]|uniref:calcium-binding and spermatid-specific protein 1 isoform X2 n=1 Tax=Antechinus flavipes TaxID=38775 RepID=UPI002235DAA6|nr:calcium-binding and spermatid-specific protein 1 isoform X2 [Antechinus flavipes]
MQKNSTETSHTVILKYEPPDSEIHTTMLKSVAPRTMAHSNPDESKKMPSKFLKQTAVGQDKVVEDATTFMPETSNPRKKRTDFSNVLDPDTGFPMEESITFIMDNFGSAGEPGPIKNKEVLGTNVEADIFKPEKNSSVTAVEAQYVTDNFKSIGSEMSTSQYSTIPSALLMSPGADRISYMDENMEMVTDIANMSAAEKVTSVGTLPAENNETPLPRAVVTMPSDNNLVLNHENPSLTPDAKTDSAAISLQEKNEVLSDDSFIVLGEREIVVEQMKSSIEDDITGVTLLNNNANPIASEDNIIQVEDSLLYDTDLIGRDKYNSENNDIILESNTSDLNKVSNSCLSNRNGLETISCKDLITFMEKNGKDEFYAKNLPGNKAEEPMEAITVIDIITEGIKTTNQEITAVEEGNKVVVKMTSFESDMPYSETIANTHKDNDFTSDRDSTFTVTDKSSLVTGSTNLAENISSLENQETLVIRNSRFSSYDTVNPRVEPKIIATDVISQKREKNQMAEITNLENDVIPTPSFIEPVTASGTTDATTSEEATTSMFSASALFPEHIKPENDPAVSRANSTPESTGDTTLLKDATVDNNQETLPSKETSLKDTNMAVPEASRSVSKKPLPVNGAPLSGWNVIIVQSDPQVIQPESDLPPVDSTLFPRTSVYTNPDTVDTVIEDPVTETATSGKKYRSLKRSVSADATINLREDTDFLTEATRYEDDIPVEEIISDVQEVAFDREEKDAITRDDITQEEENNIYPTEFSSFISSSNILKNNVLAPEDYFIFPKRKDVSPISEVNEITADLSKFVAQPISPQNNIPIMTSFSAPGGDRISFEKQDSETMSYSDLTGDMSSIAQANPTKTKVLTPLPNTPADALSAPGGDRISFEKQDSETVSYSDLTGDVSSIAQANPTMTRVLTPSLPNRPADAISVPGGKRISLGNQDSETVSYSDLTGDVSSIAQANPTMTRVLTPSLPNRPADAISVPGGERISLANQDSETVSYSDLTGDMSSIAQANPTKTKVLTPVPNTPADALSAPGGERISLGNQDSETVSYSDLTGDMSSIAQANPTKTKVLTPSPNIPGNGFFISGNGITKSNKDTTLSVETINIPEDEFTSRKIQDTHMAKDLTDLKMAKSYLLNSITDHSAPMNNLGILEQPITNTPTYFHAFPLDASRENIISSVDSIYTEYNPSITREDTASKMLYDAISTSPENPSPEKRLPVTSAATVVAEDPSPKIYSPTPTTNITRNITELTVSSVADNIPKVQIPITSAGGHLTSVDNPIPESDFLTTAVNFISTFGNFISSVTDKLTLLKEIPTSEFNTKLQCIKTPTDDVAKCISSLTNTAALSTDTIPLPEKEAIPHVTRNISSTDNDAFLVNDNATDPENKVSDFIVYDLEEWEITEFDRTIPSEEDDANTMAFIPKDNIIKEKDTLIVFDLSNSEEEDTTTSETTNSIVEDTADVNGFWIEGNPDDELNATALVLDASKNKDYSIPLASEAKNTKEHKNTMKAFLTKLVGRPNESVTNATDSLPGRLTEESHTDPTKDSTTEIDVTNLEEDDSKDIL